VKVKEGYTIFDFFNINYLLSTPLPGLSPAIQFDVSGQHGMDDSCWWQQSNNGQRCTTPPMAGEECGTLHHQRPGTGWV